MTSSSFRRSRCLLVACAALGAACGGGGAATDGRAAAGDGGARAEGGVQVPAGSFGAHCAVLIEPCTSPLFCAEAQAAREGFCTKTCATKDAPCADAPAGTHAVCLTEIQTQTGLLYACQFLCRVPQPGGAAATYACPKGLRCLNTGDPSGRYVCLQ